MPIHSPILVVPASLAGAALGMLAFWNRRSHPGKNNRMVQAAVLIAGTAAFVLALVLFARVFDARSAVFAITATMMVGSWTAVIQTVRPLRLPSAMKEVGPRESEVLRQRWTGIRLFGTVLRRTPLRYLGGAVYLRQCANGPSGVLQGIQAAEEVHVWALLLCLPALIYWGIQAWWASVAASLLVHTVLNVYPVLHLRLTRARIQRAYQADRLALVTG